MPNSSNTAPEGIESSPDDIRAVSREAYRRLLEGSESGRAFAEDLTRIINQELSNVAFRQSELVRKGQGPLSLETIISQEKNVEQAIFNRAKRMLTRPMLPGEEISEDEAHTITEALIAEKVTPFFTRVKTEAEQTIQ